MTSLSRNAGVDFQEDRCICTFMTKQLKDSPAGDSPDLRLCAHANLRKTMRVVSQVYDAALKPSGLRATQFTLLAVLSRRGDLPLTQLADILVMDRTTLTRNLKPLMAKGWIEVGREKDERVRLISITEAGCRLVAEATPLWRDAQARIVNGVGGEKLSSMIETLSLVVEKVRDG